MARGGGPGCRRGPGAHAVSLDVLRLAGPEQLPAQDGRLGAALAAAQRLEVRAAVSRVESLPVLPRALLAAVPARWPPAAFTLLRWLGHRLSDLGGRRRLAALADARAGRRRVDHTGGGRRLLPRSPAAAERAAIAPAGPQPGGLRVGAL